MTTKQAIETLETGNISEAKATLERRTYNAITRAAIEMGHGVTRALLIADWAKGRIAWQAYCAGVHALCNLTPKGGR